MIDIEKKICYYYYIKYAIKKRKEEFENEYRENI